LRTVKKVIFAVLAALALGPAASGYVYLQWGEFAVSDTGLDTGVRLFGATVQNPPPFPQPSAIQQGNTYPAAGAGSIGLNQIRGFLAGEGYPTNTFGLLIVLAPYAKVGFASMTITIAGEAVAQSEGVLYVESYMPTNLAISSMPDLDLGPSPVGSMQEVLISYDTFMGNGDIEEIELAAAPEPGPLLYLGPGLSAIILLRLKRKKDG